MFCMYSNLVTILYISLLREKMGIDDKTCSISGWDQAVLGNDGCSTQLKALQNIKGLKRKLDLLIGKWNMPKTQVLQHESVTLVTFTNIIVIMKIHSHWIWHQHKGSLTGIYGKWFWREKIIIRVRSEYFLRSSFALDEFVWNKNITYLH